MNRELRVREEDRFGAVVTVPRPVGAGRDSHSRARAREALARELWDARGRRLPTERALAAAMSACDARDVWWVCEASSAGPVYLLPTREWVRALARFVDRCGARTVLEVGAGDGFLSRCLADARPALTVVATDDHSWRRPEARMSDEDRAAFEGVRFTGIRAAPGVLRMAATTAVKALRPDLVLISWAPPGAMVERVIRAPSKLVLEFGAEGGVTGDDARAWRYNKEFIEGPLQARALCRLDARPDEARATRATLYFGAAHPGHARD